MLTYYVTDGIIDSHQKRKNQKGYGNENRDVINGNDTIQPQLSVKAAGKQPVVQHKLHNNPRQQSTKTNKLSDTLTEDVNIIQRTLASPKSTSNKSATMISGISSTASTLSQLSEIIGK
jgi:hypothetical protein